MLAAFFFLRQLHLVRSWDHYNYAKLAHSALNGIRLYSEIWMDKPPLAAFAYLPAALIGTVWAMNLEFLLVLLAIVFLLFLYFRRIGMGKFVSALGAGSYLCFSAMLIPEADYLSLEHLTNLLLIAALHLSLPAARNRDWFLAGMLLGLGTCLRHNGVLFAGWLVMISLCQRQWFAILWIGLGGVCGVAATLLLSLPFIDPAMVFYVLFQYPKEYLLAHGAPTLAQVSEMAKFFLSPVLIFVGMAALRFLWGIRKEVPKRFPGLGMLAGFLVSFVIILAPQKPHSHYGVYWFIWCALVVVWFFEPIVDGLRRVRLGKLLLRVALPVAVFFVASSFLREGNSLRESRMLRYRLSKLVPLIHEHTQPEDPIYVFGGRSQGINHNVIYIGADRVPAHAISNYCELVGDYYQTFPEEMRDFWEKMEANRPKLIVYAPEHVEKFCGYQKEDFDRVAQYFDSHYRAIENIGGFVVGVRKET